MITSDNISDIYDNLEKYIGQDVFSAWFRDTTLEPSEEGGLLTLNVSSGFIAQWIDSHYSQDLERAVYVVLNKQVALEYRVAPEKAKSLASGKIFRDVPEADRQFDLFIPDITEIPIKDDVHLMEIAPWSPQPRGETRTELVYENVNGMNIRIKSNPEYGLITALDYDLVLMMQSWLTLVSNKYRVAMKQYKAKGEGEPEKPPQWFEPDVKEILLFARNYKSAGANQRERVQAMLERLKTTEVRISKASSKKRRYGSFSLIGDWDILEESDTGNILKVRIAIPQWIYDGIVQAKTPTILTYDPDYFLLKKPFLRFLYRFCRVQSRRFTEDIQRIEIPLAELHERSGSRLPLKEFSRALRTNLKALNNGAFFDWILQVQGKREEAVLCMEPLQKALK